jgi:hypothetical protein
VVEVKCWVRWRIEPVSEVSIRLYEFNADQGYEHVHARIATDGIVATIVNAHYTQREVPHLVLEAENIRVVRDQIHDFVVCGLVRGLRVDVAAQAAWVVA